MRLIRVSHSVGPRSPACCLSQEQPAQEGWPDLLCYGCSFAAAWLLKGWTWGMKKQMSVRQAAAARRPLLYVSTAWADQRLLREGCHSDSNVSHTCLPWSQLFTSRWITAASLHRIAAAYTALTWDRALFLTFLTSSVLMKFAARGVHSADSPLHSSALAARISITVLAATLTSTSGAKLPRLYSVIKVSTLALYLSSRQESCSAALYAVACSLQLRLERPICSNPDVSKTWP